MSNEELESLDGERPEDFKAPTTGGEAEFDEHRKITVEIERLRTLREQYSKAKETLANNPDDEDLKVGMGSIEDNQARMKPIEEELAHTSRFNFQKRSELKMQLKGLREMSFDQGGRLVKEKINRDSAQQIVKEVEEQYGSEAEVENRIKDLEAKLG